VDQIRALLDRHVRAAWPHRWIALAIAWAICLAGWAAVHLIPNQYEANARLYVDADAVLTPLLKGIAADDSPSSQLDILQRTLLSRPNLEKLISKSDLDLTTTGQTDRDRLVQRLAKEIKITPETKTLFGITYRNPSPHLAYDVVRTLLNIFIESATGANRSDMENARTFLDHQIASYEQQLRGAEKRRAEFRAKYIDLLPSDANGGASRLDVARSQVLSLQGQLQDAILRRDAMKQELASTSQNLPAPGQPGSPVSAPSRLKAAQDRLAELRLRYTDNHPDVIALKALIPTLKGDDAVAPTSGRAGLSMVNPMYEQTKLRLIDAEAQVASLQRQVQDTITERERLETMARTAPGVQAEYQNLDRDYTVLRKNYEELLDRRESASIAQAANTQADKVKLQIVDPPQVPRIAVSPNRLLLIPAVLVLGLAAGAGCAFLLGQMDRSFRSLDDLRALGLPVLGGISLAAAIPVRWRIFSALGFSAAVLLLVVACGGLLGHLLRGSASV
jgi:polysaccharide chain length determinant protein (PEP-CTERM system associated)